MEGTHPARGLQKHFARFDAFPQSSTEIFLRSVTNNLDRGYGKRIVGNVRRTSSIRLEERGLKIAANSLLWRILRVSAFVPRFCRQARISVSPKWNRIKILPTRYQKKTTHIPSVEQTHLNAGPRTPHAIVRFRDGIFSILRFFVVVDRAADRGDRPLHPPPPKFFLDLGHPVSLGWGAGLHPGGSDSGRQACCAESFQVFPRRRRIQELERIVLDNPSAGNYEELGLLYLDDGNFARARACYDKAISSRTDHADPFYRRGIAEVELGDFAAAVPDLERAVKSDPDYDFHRAKGIAGLGVRANRTDRKSGRACFARPRRISTISETYYHYALFLESQGRTAEAREWAQKILEKKPTMPVIS